VANDKPITTLGDIDLEKVDLAALKKHLDAVNAAFEARKATELKTLVNGWIAKAEAVGYTLIEVIDEISNRLPDMPNAAPAKKRAAPGSKVAKVRLDADKDGAWPQLGSTYRLPDGTTWTKKSKTGRTPDKAIEAVNDGSNTWESMLVK
jgi:hypothetical protein